MLSRSRKRALLAAGALALGIAVITAGIARYQESRALARQLEIERASLHPPTPLIVTVTRDTLTRDRRFAARLEPWTSVTVATEVAGTVLRLGGELGDAVAVGQELVVLDDTLLRPALAAAETLAREAARRAREAASLVEGNAIAPTELAAAEAAAEAARHEAERLREQLRRHVLRAPFDASVQARHVERGDFLSPGQPAYTLVDRQRLRVVFHVSAAERDSFPPGTPVHVSISHETRESWTAVVRHVAPAATPDGRFRIEAILDPAPAAVPAGGAAVVQAPVRTHVDTLFVPASAVRYDGAQAVVRRLNADDTETTVPVTIGPEISGRHPVLAGLADGDRLVVR